MPLYSYQCLDCKIMFEARHSYKDKLTHCVECSSKRIQKYLGTPLRKVTKNKNQKTNTGDLVDQTIVETKHEIRKDKRKLSQRVFKVKK